MKPFKVVIVEDVKLEMKGTLEILRTEVPEAEVIGTAMNEDELWTRLREHVPELLLLDLGLGGSTTVGIDICKQVRQKFPDMRILIFTGEVLNERLWADALKAGANGIILKAGELITRWDVCQVMEGRNYVFNQPALKVIVERFMQTVETEWRHKDALLRYEIDEYDLAAVEEIYDEIQFIMATQGYKMNNAKSTLNEADILHTTQNGIMAFGVYNGEKFEVLDGSQINLDKPAHLQRYNRQREDLISQQSIVNADGKYILKVTVDFDTPSGASNFVLGGSTNGWVEWKNKDGKTLDELYRK